MSSVNRNAALLAQEYNSNTFTLGEEAEARTVPSLFPAGPLGPSLAKRRIAKISIPILNQSTTKGTEEVSMDFVMLHGCRKATCCPTAKLLGLSLHAPQPDSSLSELTDRHPSLTVLQKDMHPDDVVQAA